MANYTDVVVYSSGRLVKPTSGDTLTTDLHVTVTGTLTAENNAKVEGDLIVAGSLTVQGEVTTISTTNTVISDKLIELANGTTGAPSGDAGIIIERGDSPNAIFAWDESEDRFVLGTTSETGASSGDLTITDASLQVSSLYLGTTAVTATASELNLLDGGTSVGTSITIADTDGLLINDSGTMKSFPASDLKSYINSSAAGSVAADDIILGDGAVEITTSEGDILVDAPTGRSVDLQVAGSNVVEVASGRVDVSQPLVLGSNAGVSLTASSLATISAGNILSVDSTGQLVLSEADSGTEQVKEIIGVAIEASTTTEQAILIHTVHGSKVNVVTDGQGTTAGKPVYLSDTAGIVTSTAPSNGYVYRAGIALEATTTETDADILWMPQFIADLG